MSFASAAYHFIIYTSILTEVVHLLEEVTYSLLELFCWIETPFSTLVGRLWTKKPGTLGPKI
jgi:hypothetical protein